jgi:hypothetical protein
VFQNGVLLKGGGTDYTATSGTSVVLTTGASVSDVIEIIVYDVFSVGNFYNRTDSDSRYVNVDGTTAVTITTADNNPQLTLKSTDADGSSGPLLDLTRDSASPADGDVTGIIRFRADNDAGEVTTTGQIVSLLNDASDGTEDGELKVETMIAGSAQPRIDILPSQTVFNEGGLDIDFRVEAESNGNALRVDASADSGKGTILFGQSIASATSDGAYFSLSDTNAHLVLTNTASNAIANLYINRQGGDGRYIEFRRANAAVGSIDVSSGTVELSGFSGQHESSGIPTNTPIGTVVSTIDELDVYSAKQQSERGGEEDNPLGGQARANHAKVKVSDTVGDSSVYGVVGKFNEQEKVFVASVGIGSVRVTGACAKGDLLESNGDGTAKVQSDDIVRSKTIGKVTIGNSSTDEKLVSCVLYCG